MCNVQSKFTPNINDGNRTFGELLAEIDSRFSAKDSEEKVFEFWQSEDSPENEMHFSYSYGVFGDADVDYVRVNVPGERGKRYRMTEAHEENGVMVIDKAEVI